MLKAIGWLIKMTVFAAAVLVIANYFGFSYRGGLTSEAKSVSDQIKTQLSHAESAEVVGEVKDWAHHMTNAHRDGILKKIKLDNSAVKSGRDIARTKLVVAPPSKTTVSSSVTAAVEEISSTERQKLRALMRELNGARSTN